MKNIKIITFVVLLLFVSSFSFAQNPVRVIYDHLFYSYMKGTNTELTNQFITNFVRDYHPDVYRDNFGNDFLWHDVLTKYRNEITTSITNINLTAEYFFNTGMDLGNYDFDKDGFSVRIAPNVFIPYNSTEERPGNLFYYLPVSTLHFTNFSEYNLLKMSRDDGNAFLRSRTNNNVTNRRVSLRVYFTINDFASSEYVNLIRLLNPASNLIVLGTVYKVEVYDGTRLIGELSKS